MDFYIFVKVIMGTAVHKKSRETYQLGLPSRSPRESGLGWTGGGVIVRELFDEYNPV